MNTSAVRRLKQRIARLTRSSTLAASRREMRAQINAVIDAWAKHEANADDLRSAKGEPEHGAPDPGCAHWDGSSLGCSCAEPLNARKDH